ncbi:hypothetical protein FHT82_005915 [Rhizobium sp. BK275]|uniref:hypothetical protein n=1 Tax=unclassified Rhizobium TaxID=2613769 RepID=UPI001621773A|nr:MULTISPECIES: hypothetical protein [unclassified Rhizobium]MBB3393122.1 hypothetical protein [Rhizobium sp. BK275]MBB3409864.1 hypothetical protein [Rhizobium sp. BK316]
MKKILSLLAAMALFASGAFAQDAKKDPLEGVVRFMGRINPLLQAIYQDHMDVARKVYGEGWADVYEERRILAAVIRTYGTPALSRASDSAVISVMNKNAALAEIVAEKYPEGCEYFFTGNMPNWALVPEVRDGRMADLRAKAYAYQDGKFRADTGVMTGDKQYVIMTQYLGMTADEVFKSMTAPVDVSDEDMCALAKKINNVGVLPKELQGDWGRAWLGNGPSPQKKKPAADAKAESRAVAQETKPGSFEKEMQVLAGINPFVHAVFMDHEDEARQLFATAEASGGKIDPRVQAAAMVAKYGNPALSRASDTIAIDVLKKTGELNEALARYYPQGCKDLVTMRVSQSAQAIPQVKERYFQYLEAKRLAYEDGKTRPPAAVKLTAQEILQMITQHLGVTAEEAVKLTKLAELSDKEACSITMRLNAIDPVPEAQRGIWARTAMSWAG